MNSPTNLRLIALLAGAGWTVAAFQAGAAVAEWPRLRGPDGTGVVEAPGLPTDFGQGSVLWTRDLGGAGHSSPVAREGKVFLTLIPSGQEENREVICVSAETGEVEWRKAFPFKPYPQHSLNSYAASTATVDGGGVYVFWTEAGGSEALSLDLQGNLRWRTPLGAFEAQHGSGASPALVSGVLVVPKENRAASSFLTGLDPKTGEELWKVSRPSERTPYVTPVVRTTGDGVEVVYSSTTFGLTGLDPKSGKERWKYNPNFEQRCVGSPVIMGDAVFAATGQGGGGKESVAVQIGEGGAVKELYRVERGLPYVPTPLYHDGLLFLMSDGGILACHRATDGEALWRERVCGPVYSSPLCINGVLHLFGRQGEIVTVRASERFEKLAEASVEEEIRATPAVMGDRLYVRTMTRLICFGKR